MIYNNILSAANCLIDLAGDKPLHEELQRLASLICARFRMGNKVLICGNGGSFSQAQHLAAEFVGHFSDTIRPALPAIALGSSGATLTALANDYSYAEVFSHEVVAYGNKGDLLIGFTTSGKSVNVLAAVATARAKGLLTAAFTGASGMDVQGPDVDLTIRVPSFNTQHIQEAHLVLAHILVALVEQGLYRAEGSGS